MDKLDFLKEELQASKDSGLYNTIRTVQSAQGAWIVVDGIEYISLFDAMQVSRAVDLNFYCC